MTRQQVQGDQIEDGTIQLKDIDTSTVGQALITKLQGVDGIEIVSSSGADSGTGVVTIKVSGGFGTDYYAFQALAEQLTVSDGWVPAALFTTPSIKSGKYVIHYKAQLTCSSKKPVGYQVEASDDGVNYTPIEESIKSPTTADVYETRAAFEEITLNTDGPIYVRTNFGQTTAGGTGKIKLISVYLFKVGEL